MRHVFVAGIKVATASRVELADEIVRDCVQRRHEKHPVARLLFDSNGHGISLAARDAEFRTALEQADVIHADGGFVVLASRYLAGAAVAERSATTDMIHDIARAGLTQGLSHYLLGGTEQVNAECAERLRQMYPGLVVAGRRNGYFGAGDERQVVEGIAAARPDVLWVGLGKPREQLFAAAMRHRFGASWAITCGGCFNYITGDYPRAPKWMQDNHLEWLFRAMATPRLMWRYVTTSPHAIWLAFKRRDRRVL